MEKMSKRFGVICEYLKEKYTDFNDIDVLECTIWMMQHPSEIVTFINKEKLKQMEK